MESKRTVGSEFFSGIFGSISGGLSIFSNNPFRRNDERLDRTDSSGGVRNVSASPPDCKYVNVPSKEERNLSNDPRSEEESFEKLRKGKHLHRQKVIQRFPEMELERGRKRVRMTEEEKSTGYVASDPPDDKRSEDSACRKTTKKKKTDNVYESSLHTGIGGILEDNSNCKQDVDHQPGTPDGSDGISAAKRSKREKRIYDETDVIVSRKRQRRNLSGRLQERDTRRNMDKNLDNQGTNSAAFSILKRKRDNEVEERYEKKYRSGNISFVNERSAETLHEEEDVQNDGKTHPKAEDLSTRKRKRSDSSRDDDEKLKRTVFVGNMSLKVKKKSIIKEFSRYGAVESVRLRSVPILDTKIPRKGAIIKGQINDAVDSQHAYIVFKESSSANAALAHNMKEFKGNHVRVDVASPPSGLLKGKAPFSYDHSRSIFVGNIPFDVKDEELYQIFSGQAPEADIEAVRVVRDPQTSLSKGIAFILFKTQAGANRVLSSKCGLTLRDRTLRICRVRATQIEQKQVRPGKRWRTSDEDEIGLQRKRSKLSTSYEGTRATRDGKTAKHSSPKLRERLKINHSKINRSQPGSSYRSHQKQAATSVKEFDKTTVQSSGFKRKRIEKRQRGLSRSKKIRRS